MIFVIKLLFSKIGICSLNLGYQLKGSEKKDVKRIRHRNQTYYILFIFRTMGRKEKWPSSRCQKHKRD